MPRARKLGRRPRAGKTAAEIVKLRATGDERARWQQAARRQGLSLSQWLREAAELACNEIAYIRKARKER